MLLQFRRDVEVGLVAVDQLASLLGRQPLELVAFPERDHSSDHRVEVIVRDGAGQELAVEHTYIEPWDGVRRDAAWMHRLFPGYCFSDPRIPGGSYRLTMDRGALQGIGKPDRARVRRELVEWVVAKAPLLKPHDPPHPGHSVTSNGETPIPVVLLRTSDGTAPTGTVQVRIGVKGSESERFELRRERMRRAIDSKHPKLLAHRAFGRSTVLVFESDNLYEDNEDLIERAYRDETTDDQQPDHLVIVSTVAPQELACWFPLIDGQWHDDDSNSPMLIARLA